MHHIVINYQQRQQYILIVIVTIVISFGLGYWFGYHSNSSDELATVLSQIENQPVEDDASYTPDWSGEGLPPDKDVKTTGEKSENLKAETKPAIDAKPAVTPAPARPAPKPVEKPVVTTPPVVPKPLPVVAPAPVTPAVSRPAPEPAPAPINTAPVTPAPEAVTAGESITNSSLSAESANTVFTVQAGVFENRDNAMKLVNELNARGFDAYIDEIVSSAGETKFNVRFGRNTDREQVQRKLTRFKQLYTTSAYIIILDK